MYYRSGQVCPFVLTTGGLILANKFERPQRMSDRVENAGMGMLVWRRAGLAITEICLFRFLSVSKREIAPHGDAINSRRNEDEGFL